VPLFQWDADIAKNAQAWADQQKGTMAHSSSQFRTLPGIGYCGENLAWGVTDAGAVKMWYDEIQYTDGGRVSSFDGQSGHYTQVVWKSSLKLGCGVYDKLLVCQYGPGGNMGGQFTNNVLPPVSGAQC